MKTPFITLLFLLSFYAAVPLMGVAKPSESTDRYPLYQLGVEIGGAAVGYSLFGSLRPFENLAFNLGIEVWGTDALILPGSVSLLVGKSNHLFELLGGGAFSITNDDSAFNGKFVHTSLLPEIGIGYRYWPKDGGFHFRSIFYVLFTGYLGDSKISFIPFLGLSFGYAF